MKKLLLLVAVLASFMALAVPLAASANYDPFSGVDCSGDASTSAVCNDKSSTDTNPLTGPNGRLINITHFVAYTGGIASVIVVIVGGIQYVTADGDSGKITSARKTIEYALIGLAVIALAQTLITYVVTKIGT